MDPTMYLFLNKGAGMSTGKSAAQAGHAAVEAYRLTQLTLGKSALVEEWYKGGGYKKIVLEADDETHLLVIQKYIEARGFCTRLIIDEGHTEVRPHTATALGVELVDKDDEHTAATFGSFKLYKDEPKEMYVYHHGWSEPWPGTSKHRWWNRRR